MRDTIGIRRESVDPTEKRAPLTPEQVKRLVDEYGLRVLVEPSNLRAYLDEDYADAGAELTGDLSDSNIIFGISQFSPDRIIPGRVYCFFSHTVKAQRYNMPMLRHIIESGCTLLDYELVANGNNMRLVSFGAFGGYAGMIDALSVLGKRLDHEGFENPFSAIKTAREYRNLADAETAIVEAGEKIRAHGLPQAVTPFVCGFTGKGQVSKAAQKIFRLLPAVEIRPEDLAGLKASGAYSRNAVYYVEFRKPDLYRPRDPNAQFNQEAFEKMPARYESCFHRFADSMTMMVNGIQWSSRFPRLLTKNHMREVYESSPEPQLRVITDISCDIEGSIEFTVKSITYNDPVYTYEPLTGKVIDGYEGHGPVILAVDKFAAGLPLESTESFGKALLPFIQALAGADFSRPLAELDVPEPFKKAIIVHQGNLTANFRYLNEFIL